MPASHDTLGIRSGQRLVRHRSGSAYSIDWDGIYLERRFEILRSQSCSFWYMTEQEWTFTDCSIALPVWSTPEHEMQYTIYLLQIYLLQITDNRIFVALKSLHPQRVANVLLGSLKVSEALLRGESGRLRVICYHRENVWSLTSRSSWAWNLLEISGVWRASLRKSSEAHL